LAFDNSIFVAYHTSVIVFMMISGKFVKFLS